nr:hypothetical protein [Variovorax paradoxus]
MSPNNSDDPTPSVADEVSTVVDDAEVISKTLPSTRRPPAGLTDQACHVLSVTRDHVAEHPAQAVLIAAVGGAALSAALIAWMHDDRSSGDRRERRGRTGA